MYPGEAPQRYSPAYLEAAQEHARRTGRHKCGKTKGGPPPGFPLGEFGPGAPFPPPGPAVPGSVDDYTAAMAKNYQEYASAMMKPEYSAHWAQLASKFWQGQYPGGGPHAPGPLAGYPGTARGPGSHDQAFDKAYLATLKYWPDEDPQGKRPARAGTGDPQDEQPPRKRDQQRDTAKPAGAAGNSAPPPAAAESEKDARLRRLADRPVVSPFQRNAVFGVDGMLVTGNARKKAQARHNAPSKQATKHDKGVEESSGGKGRDFSLPSTRSTDTGPDSRDTSNNAALRGGKGPAEDRKNKSLYPYMHPALTKSVLGEANYHSMRSLIMRQQDAFAQQVKDLHRVVDTQRKLMLSKTTPEDASPTNNPAEGEMDAKREAPRPGKSCLQQPPSPQRRADTHKPVVGRKRAAGAYEDGEPCDDDPKARRTVPTTPARSPAGSDSEQAGPDKKARAPRDYPASGSRDYMRDYAAAAAASYSYHAMLQQMAAGGAMPRMPVPPGAMPYGMASPYAMDYYAAMQNPAWYPPYAGGPPNMPPPPR
mmetsp:Transcript_43308/g.109659  ORF Transcript_43308/g.109659 Transcript_43308/m.109659 type:complete len:536 (+) Transcript_43308:222-1829(+)